MANLKSTVPALDLRNRKVVVLGAGGSAAAIAGNLLAEGVAELCIVNRSLPRAQAIADRFGSGIRPVGWDRRAVELAEASLLVNTTSLGMTGQAPLDISLAALPSDAVVADIVYTPLVTESADGRAGCRSSRGDRAGHAAASGRARLRKMVRPQARGHP